MSTQLSNNKRQTRRVRPIRQQTSVAYSCFQYTASNSQYYFVFKSITGALCSVLLIFSFLLQISYVHASEIELSESTPEDEFPIFDSPTSSSLDTDETGNISDIGSVPLNMDNTDTEVGDGTGQLHIEEPEELHDSVIGSRVTEGEVDEVIPGPTPSDPLVDIVEPPIEPPIDDPGDDTDSGGGTDILIEPPIEQEPEIVPLPVEEPPDIDTATDTDIVVVNEQAVTTTFNDGDFVFSDAECTALASGSFYCHKDEVATTQHALYTALDEDGDLEIYLSRGEMQIKVTDNNVDDAAPYYDKNSEHLVWHRLVDDRYQIVSFDITTGEEIVLTKGIQNNMEPIRQGKYTVWQRWTGDNWDIMLSNGKQEVQITDTPEHDLAPYIHGSLIVWNRYTSSGEKTIEMYDMSTETYVTVEDPDGMSVSNPRMVFVYDSLHPNGDIVTKGYDLLNRKFIQLDTLPRELPDRVPPANPTGDEVTALIQAKTAIKSDETVTNELANDLPVLDGPEKSLSEAASGTDMTLDLTQSQLEETVVDPAIESSVEYDLIITPLTIDTN